MKSCRALLSVLLATLMVLGGTLSLAHQVAHASITLHGAAPTVNAQPNNQATVDFLTALFGHDAGEQCQSWDAATGLDANCRYSESPAFLTANTALVSLHATPQIITADLFGVSLARAPPQI